MKTITFIVLLAVSSACMAQTETSTLIKLMGEPIKETPEKLEDIDWRVRGATDFYTKDGGLKMNYEVRGDESMSTDELFNHRYLIEFFVYEQYFHLFENDFPFDLYAAKPFKECLKNLKKHDDIIDLNPDKNKNYIEFTYTGSSPFKGKNGIDVRLEFHWGDKYSFRSIELKKPE